MPIKPTEDEEISLVCSRALKKKPDDRRQKIEEESILEASKERLLTLERGIERRYLKQPFTKG